MVRSNAKDELNHIQNVLDKLYPGPVHILVVSPNSKCPYYITKYHTTGRELICHEEAQRQSPSTHRESRLYHKIHSVY